MTTPTALSSEPVITEYPDLIAVHAEAERCADIKLLAQAVSPFLRWQAVRRACSE